MEKENLFVAEDEEMSDSPSSEQYQDTVEAPEDDPVIRSIPLIHSQLPDRNTQTLHVLQFAGRPHTRAFSSDHLKALVKRESKVVELKVPMDTQKFYDETRTEELGQRVEHVSLRGVLCDTNGGLYVGNVVEKDGQAQIMLIPLDSTAQLKALFKYIDDIDTARTAQVRQESVAEAGRPSAVHVLQTASKPSAQLALDGQSAGGFGSCLKHVKKFNEEEWTALSWRNGEDSANAKLKQQLDGVLTEPVSTKTLLDEFL